MSYPTKKQKEKIRILFKEKYNRELTDQEVLECYRSLLAFAHATANFLLQSKNSSVTVTVNSHGGSHENHIKLKF